MGVSPDVKQHQMEDMEHEMQTKSENPEPEA